MGKIQKNKKWRAVSLGTNLHTPDLISIEELVDYTAVKGNTEKGSYLDNEDDGEFSKKKKNKKKKSQQSSQGKSEKAKKKRKPSKVISPVPAKKQKVDSEDPDQETDEVVETEDDSSCDMAAWECFSLPDPIIKALSEKQFTKPTEIQALTLPEAIVKKKDILGAAETGSGKTLAFVIPIVTAILEAQQTDTDVNNKLWAVIVTPTRELSIQVKNHAQDLCKFTGIKIVEVVGGLSVEKQARKLNERPHIVVGTPGRLWELIRMGNEHLAQIDKIRFFVIDEADRMLEKNHYAELSCVLERINQVGAKHSKRQTFVFSATLTLIHDTPSYVFKKKKRKGKMKKGTGKMTLENKLQSFISSLGLQNPSIIDITKKNVLATGIYESCIECSVEEKDQYLYYLVKMHTGRKIVFCNSISCVRRVHRMLGVLQCNVKILFADIAQNQRLKNLESFQKDPNGLLLATDVAARGLDIPSVEYIIHYEVPKTSELYVHRSGRSVRGASAEGTSILLVSPTETYNYNKIRRTLGNSEKMSSYTISSPELMLTAKRLVSVGKKIEQLENKMRSVQSNANWIEKCAKEMDIIIDEDEMPKKFDDSTRKSYQLEIKRLRTELKHLKSKPILPLQGSLRYPSFAMVQSYLEENARKRNQC